MKMNGICRIVDLYANMYHWCGSICTDDLKHVRITLKSASYPVEGMAGAYFKKIIQGEVHCVEKDRTCFDCSSYIFNSVLFGLASVFV